MKKRLKNTSYPDSNLNGEVTSIILESISDGVFTVDSQWRITSFNRAAEEITGVSRKEAIGRQCSEVFRASMCEVDCALRQTMRSGTPIINRSAFIVDSQGRRVPVTVSTALLLDAKGNMIGGVETFRDLSLVEELRKRLKSRYKLGDLVSSSPAMGKIFSILPQVAESNSTVLIQGETGTGKELLARAIHDLSPRHNRSFVAVNCSALPDTLLESELFGYKAGAFTGAVKDKPGRFALADGGTIFLDEIGELKTDLQVRLLRVLQDKTFEPLGGTESITADVRVIAATNLDLAAQVGKRVFRQDLYYRINIIGIELPPLRKRKEDIALLVEHFVAQLNKLQGKAIRGVDPEVLALLMAHSYPGNVRELENIIEHAFVLCRDDFIAIKHLPEAFVSRNRRQKAGMDRKAAIREVERRTIMDALKRNNNNRLATARQLGIHKSTLFRKMKSLGIAFPKTDGRRRPR